MTTQLAHTTTAVNYFTALWRDSGAHPSTEPDRWKALSEIAACEQGKAQW